MYPVVFFDALRVKIRDEATVRSKGDQSRTGGVAGRSRDIRGIWSEQTEGRQVLDEGVQRSQGPRLSRHPHRGDRRAQGMSEALAAVYPETTLQTSIVHLVRQSLDF